MLPWSFEINPPEMRRRSQKFHADPDPLRSAVAGKNNPALLLFLCLWVHQHQHVVVDHFVPQHQQAAVRVDHQRLAHLAELLSGMAAAERLQLHAVKHPVAAPIGGKGCFLHNEAMMRLASEGVNCPFVQVFPKNMAFSGVSAL